MSISSVNGSTTTTTASSATTTSKAASNAMDKNAFMKLLIAQLQNQDPLQPAQGTEFVSQLAQFSLVEQSQNQATALGNISTQLSGLASNEAAALVGKTVTIGGSGTLSWNGTLATSGSVNLAAAAAGATVTIQDASGATVRTMTLGPQPAGALAVTWNGLNDAGQATPSGTYTMKVSATTADGKSIDVQNQVSGIVTQVNFDKGYPEVVLNSGATAPISNLVGVGGSSK